ncbi:hypothetical protein ACOSP7_004963 [Xanthoceras sorbifolium]
MGFLLGGVIGKVIDMDSGWGHLVRECFKNVHNTVNKSELRFGAWMRTGDVGFGRDRKEGGTVDLNHGGTDIPASDIVGEINSDKAVPEASKHCVEMQDMPYVFRVYDIIPVEKSQFAKDPSKLVDTKGLIMEGGDNSFVFKGSLED